MGVSLPTSRFARVGKVGVLRATLSLRCYAPPPGQGFEGEGLRTVLMHALRMPHARTLQVGRVYLFKALPRKYLIT
ncbi:MAG: hypothetical protein NZ455_12445 [Bacteroidia bacterium]|nr:hypothetical protein [Bacteroidia bacterium]MDW8345884.1 hypothetical protein [Bacteroidia bacterium]